MAQGTPITIVGNTTDDVVLRFTPNGTAVGDVTVASTPSTFNKQTNQWDDGEPEFWPCTIWREQAENATESIPKGTRVVVTGRVKVDAWEDKNGGGRRTRMTLDVDDIGPSMKFATAQVRKAARGGNQQGGGYGGQQGGYGGGPRGGYNQGGFGGNQQGGYGAAQGGQTSGGFNGPQGNQQGGAQPQQGGQRGGYQDGPQGGQRQGGGFNGPQGGNAQPWQNEPTNGFDMADDQEPPF